VDSSILIEELEPLKALIDQVREKVDALEGDLRLVETELETFSTDQQRFDALGEACKALDRLDELAAADLFWQGLPGDGDNAGHVERLRARIIQFEEGIRAVEEKRVSITKQINLHLDELDSLHDEVINAYAREERRKEEYLVEREISPIPYRSAIMPWSHEGESEGRFRRALLIALIFCLFFGYLIPAINVPIPDRSVVVEIPERLAMLVKKEPPKPEPVPEPPKEEIEEEQEEAKEDKPKEEPEKKKAEKQPAPTPDETQVARKKAESTGVLAFKSSFEDLMDEIPVASLGVEARLDKDASMAAGQARAQRSLVAMQSQGGGSGIGNAGVSRNIGSSQGGSGKGIGDVGFARVASAVADLAAEEGRPVSDGPGPARTDEEIQIVFDRYKAALYRIYNKELRKNPTLRGKMLLRITIESGGEVSMCKVESTDLDSKELVAQILERVQKFNFGPKEGVPKTTILYPIDFLPAG
jgi:hypothetical protein